MFVCVCGMQQISVAECVQENILEERNSRASAISGSRLQQVLLELFLRQWDPST